MIRSFSPAAAAVASPTLATAGAEASRSSFFSSSSSFLSMRFISSGVRVIVSSTDLGFEGRSGTAAGSGAGATVCFGSLTAGAASAATAGAGAGEGAGAGAGAGAGVPELRKATSFLPLLCVFHLGSITKPVAAAISRSAPMALPHTWPSLVTCTLPPSPMLIT